MSHSTATGPMTGVQPAKSGVARIVRFLDQNFVWVLLVLLMVLGRVSHPLFLSPQNLTNILYSSAPLGCLLLAQALVLISGNFDLSTEANMIFSAVLAGYFMQAPEAGGAGWPWPAALMAMLAAATGVGLVNGLLVVKLRMNAFMTTLAMLVALGGVSLAITRGRGQPLVPEGFRWAGFENIGPIPVAVIFLLLLYLLAHVVLTRTVFGAHLYAVGGNRRAARTAGVTRAHSDDSIHNCRPLVRAGSISARGPLWDGEYFTFDRSTIHHHSRRCCGWGQFVWRPGQGIRHVGRPAADGVDHERHQYLEH